MKATQRSPAEQAIANYTVMSRSLLGEARQLEKRRQPLSARRLRYLAEIVDRAAFAEGTAE